MDSSQIDQMQPPVQDLEQQELQLQQSQQHTQQQSSSSPPPPSTSAGPTTSSRRIKLQIGEKTFHTTLATVSPSGLLSTLCSLPPPPDNDGAYFLDADPDLFAHILRHLRTGIYPIFYGNGSSGGAGVNGAGTGSYDLPLYHALLAQARYYRLPLLEAWIVSRRYLDAVSLRAARAGTLRLCGEEQIARLDDMARVQPGESLRVLTARESVARDWTCPNKLWRHCGSREACIRGGCISRLSNIKVAVEMRVVEVEYVVTAVELNEEVALPAVAAHEDSLMPPPYHAETPAS